MASCLEQEQAAGAEAGRPAPQSGPPPGFLLTNASALGTLAAARCLGRHGVPVLMLDAHRLAPGLWSRHVTRRSRCPPPRPIERYVQALLAFGSRHPGHVLYATSDDLAWAFAQRQGELRRFFRLLTPPFSSVASVLDKRSLYRICEELDVPTPVTWFPESEADVDRVAASARFPVIIKPRAQVYFTSARKGVRVACASDLRERYRAFRRDNTYETTITRDRPDIAQPMIQELHAAEPIYSLSGFRDPSSGLLVARGARKVLQWPRQAGIGIAFEDAPLDGALADGTRRLCERTGFFGVFEAEFVTTAQGMRLIDFNPRLFNQIGFDAARGLPSPYLVYLAATDDRARLQAAMAAAASWHSSRPAVFQHASIIAWTRAAERLVGRRPARSPFDSRDAAGGSTVVDAAADPADPLPGVVDALQQLRHALVHPRSSLRAAARGHG